LKARPKYNRTSKKYNIAVNNQGHEIMLGHQNGAFVKYTEFNSKKEAIEYIESRKDKLTLAKDLQDFVMG
jgi:hypothetical protein